MNDKLKKIIAYIIILLCLSYGIFTTIQWTRNHFQLRETRNTLEQCRLELTELRDELNRATDQQSAIADGINRCTEITNRTDLVLGQSITTIEDLRTTLFKIRKNEEDLENELYSLRRIVYDRPDNNDNTN